MEAPARPSGKEGAVKLALLSDILDASSCPASKSRFPDEIFAIGCAMVGARLQARDASEQADVERQARALLTVRDFRRPRRPDEGVKDEYKVHGTEFSVINDLYVPGSYVDPDGFMHIHFPVSVRTPLSSSFMARDWRFVALAWIAVVDSGETPTKLIFTAFDAAGRRVLAMVEPDILDAFKAMLKTKRKDVEVPGPVCHRCNRAEVCDTLATVLDPHLEGVAEPLPKDRGAVTEALFFQRMELESRIEILEGRKQKTDVLLNKMCVEGVLKVGNESIQIPRRKGHQWDYAKAFRVLQPVGLWRDSFASIKVANLQAAMEEFPPEIKKQLEDARVETTTEPSISEAAKHGRTVKTTLLRGVTKVRR